MLRNITARFRNRIGPKTNVRTTDRRSAAAIESLEARQFLSASLPAVGEAAASTAAVHASASAHPHGRTLHLKTGQNSSGDVGTVSGFKGAASGASNLSASIDWGDGTDASAGQVSVDKHGRIHVAGQHTFAAAGHYSVTVTVNESPAGTSGQPAQVAVIHSKAVVSGHATPALLPSGTGVTIQETAGVAFTADLGSFTTIAPASNLVATISWGDATHSTGTVTTTGGTGVDVLNLKVSGSHTYAKAGTYPIHIVVTRTPPALPSGATPAVLTIVAQIDSTAQVSAAKSLSLNGTITGTYTIPPGIPDVGSTYDLTGSGAADGPGQVSASGSVHLPGFIPTGQAGGSLTLTNAKGSVTLSLTGPSEPGFGPFPGSLTYAITGGTGAFAGATGSGTIDATTAADDSGGTFTFVLHSA